MKALKILAYILGGILLVAALHVLKQVFSNEH